MVRRLVISLLVIVLTLSISVVPGYAEVNPPLKISLIATHVMPEYDTTDVLVIHGINFMNNSPNDYSGEVRFAVPKGTTNNIVVENTPESKGNDSHLSVKVEDKGEHAELVWNPTKPIKANESYPVHLEYYYNSLPGTGQKEFTYTLFPISDIDQAQVNVYQPLKATEFKMEPEGKFAQKDSEGFNIYSINTASLRKGQNYNVKISYNKTDAEPSIKAPTSFQTTGSSGKEKGSLSSAAVLFPMVGMLALVILIAIKSFNTPSVDVDSTRRPKKSNPGNLEKKPSSKAESSFAQEKRKLRQKLLDGEISEETYREILADIEQDYK
ncbi:hypothetical protein SDC9_20817 [bioreactor metagenome]|uniref:Uncharacterized protein n=1 Tax=bioreactor metagenome TaxID=1076179 RepID=A0A644U7T3_9ZZZZ|nr:hypothetical protein [Desulfitobacterium hafniense]MEA5024589.1 hypothetical protein [Desulfitobacterium hafniense]